MFNDSNVFLRTDRHIRSFAGNVTRFSEYQPRSVPVNEIMEFLLLHLYAHNISWHLGGRFGNYMAQIFNSYQTIRLFAALNFKIYSFRRRGCRTFQTRRIRIHPTGVRCRYYITAYNLAGLFVYWIDSVDSCRPESNIDFVHFVWDNSENISFLHHCTTLLSSLLPPYYLYLAYQGCERLMDPQDLVYYV